MKRLVALLCCLVIVAVSVPFSVSATKTNVDFKVNIIYGSPSIENLTEEIVVLDTTEKVNEIAEIIFPEDYDFEIRDYFNNLPDGFFEDKALLLVPATVSSSGYNFIDFAVTKDGKALNARVDIQTPNPNIAQLTAVGYYAVIFEIDKAALNGVNDVSATIRHIPFSEGIDFKAQMFSFNSGADELFYEFRSDKAYIFDTAEKAQEFFDRIFATEYTENDTELLNYCNNLPKSFFKEKALVVAATYTGDAGYNLTALDLVKNWSRLDIIAQLDGGGPDMPECHIIVMEVDKDVLINVKSVNADINAQSIVDTQSNGIEYEAKFFELDYFPIDYSDDGLYEMPDVFVLNTPKKVDEFLEINFQDSYKEPHLTDYLNGLYDYFFGEKAVLIQIFETGYPNHNFTKASVGKQNGVMSIECEHTVDLGAFPSICGYYAVVIELDRAYLWDVEEFDVTTKNITEYKKLEYRTRTINGYIAEENLEPIVPGGDKKYPAPFIVTNDEELANLVNICESEALPKYAEDLADDFFETKALVAIYQEFDYTNVTYYCSNIIDDFDGDGSAWRINMRADQYNRVEGKDYKLFIFEIDKEYADCHFQCTIKKTNIKGDVLNRGTEFIEVMDYVALKRFYFGTYKLTKTQQKLGDINENGIIDSMDYVLLKRAYFGTYKI